MKTGRRMIHRVDPSDNQRVGCRIDSRRSTKNFTEGPSTTPLAVNVEAVLVVPCEQLGVAQLLKNCSFRLHFCRGGGNRGPLPLTPVLLTSSVRFTLCVRIATALLLRMRAFAAPYSSTWALCTGREVWSATMHGAAVVRQRGQQVATSAR
eukprot:SAG11_NODE_641_length_8008_cov_2.916171_7_plen_151_part_00